MKENILCDCGHIEKIYSIEKVEGKTYCHFCWKLHKTRAGLTDTGCIFPEAKVCTDREPAVFEERTVDELEKAICYRGHKNCKKHGVDDFLTRINKALKGNQAICPNTGCNKTLEKITTRNYTTLVCPVHGVISKIVTERDTD